MITYLALGDSYTIGELVQEQDNLPHQVIQLLKNKNIACSLTNTIAKTGWTTDELLHAIDEKKLNEQVDWVTLLIGVNNQYRGYALEVYQKEFELLLQLAISLAKGDASHVIVLSIPDWGLTPFNITRDKHTTSHEIDLYNAAKKEITDKYHSRFIEITSSTRAHAQDAHYLAEDSLHPSKYEYAIWAQKVADIISTA